MEQDACAVAGLVDESLMRRCLRFYSSAAEWLLDIITQGQGVSATFPLPQQVPLAFGALPDYFIEDIAEFLLFIDMLVEEIDTIVQTNFLGGKFFRHFRILTHNGTTQ